MDPNGPEDEPLSEEELEGTAAGGKGEDGEREKTLTAGYCCKPEP